MMRRLLTDPKMQKVWPILQRTPAQPYALVEWQRNHPMRALDAATSAQDKACALFFHYAMLAFGGLSLRPPTWTRRMLEENTARWRSAAQMCRDDESTLYGWWHIEAALDAGLATAPAELDVELAMALQIVGEHFERKAKQYESPGWSVCVIDRSRGRGDDKVRVGVQVLAAETHRLFGNYLFGTLATVATVALGLQTGVTKKRVENWCGGLQQRGGDVPLFVER